MLNAIIKGKFKKEDEAKLISEVEILASRNADTIPKLILSYDTRAAEVSLWKQLENDLDEQKRDLLEEFEQETINKQSSKKSLLAQKKSQLQQSGQQSVKEPGTNKPAQEPAHDPKASQSPSEPRQDPLNASKAAKDDPNNPMQPSAAQNPPQDPTSTALGTSGVQPTTNTTQQANIPPGNSNPADPLKTNNPTGAVTDPNAKTPVTGTTVPKPDPKATNKATPAAGTGPAKDTTAKKPTDKPVDKPTDKPVDKPKTTTPAPASTEKPDPKQSGTLPKVGAGNTGTQPPLVKQDHEPEDF